MSGVVPAAIAGLIVLVCAAVIRARLRQEDGGSALRTCIGCLFIVSVLGAIGSAGLRIWGERGWSAEADRILVQIVSGGAIHSGGEWLGPGPVEIELAAAPFDREASPESIVDALFPRRTRLAIQAQGVTTSETPRGHWIGTTYSVLLRTADGKLDPVVLFRRTIAEDPLEPARIAILRGAQGADRNVTPLSVGIEYSDSSFLERFFFLDEPPRLTVDLQFQKLPPEFRGQEFWLEGPR